MYCFKLIGVRDTRIVLVCGMSLVYIKSSVDVNSALTDHLHTIHTSAMSHNAFTDYAVLRPKVLNLANDSTVPDDVLNIWYKNALVVLDDPENVQYLSLFIGTMMGGTTKDVFQLMHSSASTFGATGGTRYVCAAVVTHAKAAATQPPSLGESAGKRVARALHALALLWANSMVHLCEDDVFHIMLDRRR